MWWEDLKKTPPTQIHKLVIQIPPVSHYIMAQQTISSTQQFIPSNKYRPHYDMMFGTAERLADCHPVYTSRQTMFIMGRIMNKSPLPCDRNRFVRYNDPLLMRPGQVTLIDRSFVTPTPFQFWFGQTF